jgi:DNA-directed RNA polymerase beta' subunit
MVGVIAAQTIGEPTTQMSLCGSTKLKIIVKNKNNIKYLSISISDFCNNFINNYPQLTFNTGYINSVETDINNLENEYYISSVDKYENIYWNKISHISKHPVNGNMIKVVTKSGRVVKTTLSHSHLIRHNQEIIPIDGALLKVGMRIPVSKNINNIYIKKFIKINNKKYKLDFLFGYIIGIFYANGYIDNNNIYFNDINNYFTESIKIFAYKFNIKIILQNNLIILSNKYLSNFLTKNINYRYIANFIFISPNIFKIGFLQSYFDLSGFFTNNIFLYNNSHQLMKDISLLLNYFNIFSRIKYNSYYNKYQLIIDSKYALLYKNNINTKINVDKLNNIILSNKSNNNYNDEIDKIDDVKYIILECFRKLKLKYKLRFFTDNKPINRKLLIKYINIFKSNTNKEYIKYELQILKQAAYSDIIWDEIIEIVMYTPNQNDYVYDLTIPYNQTFMIDNGIFVHNTLNTKHFAGVTGKGSANMGISRVQELLHYSKNIKTPQMTIYFKENYNNDKTKLNKIFSHLKYIYLKDLISTVEVFYDSNTNNMYDNILKNDNADSPFFINNVKVNLKTLPLVFRFKMNIEKLLNSEITIMDIKTIFVTYWYNYYNNIKNLKKNEKNIISKINNCAILSNKITDKENIIHIRFNMITFNYDIIIEFLRMVMNDIKLKGIHNIEDYKEKYDELNIKYDNDTGDANVSNEAIVKTNGINMEVLRRIKGIDLTRTMCNDIFTILRLYGIEAARHILLYEISLAFVSGGTNINRTHLTLLIDQMTYLGEIISIDRHGMDKIDNDPLTKASFEKTMNHFINAALFNEIDTLKSISSRIIMGKVINGGTGCFELLLDTQKIANSEYIIDDTSGRITFKQLEKEILITDTIKYSNNIISFFIPSNIYNK